MKIHYYAPRNFKPDEVDIIRRARKAVFGDDPVTFERVGRPGYGVLSFGVDADGGIRTIPLDALTTYPYAEAYVALALVRLENDGPVPYTPPCAGNVLYLDIEAHSIDEMWNMGPRQYFRLGQYAWNDGEVQLTTDYDELIRLIHSADMVVAHNGWQFDFSVLLGNDALWLKGFDTLVHASLAIPAPFLYLDRKGHVHKKANKPAAAHDAEDESRGWFSLDNLSFQLGLEGKIGDLKALAEKHGGFGKIPLDDPEFLDYAVQDVIALRDLCSALCLIAMPFEYAWREQTNASIDGQNSRNGWKVDIEVCAARRDELAKRRDEIVANLEQKYGFPTDGKMPWRSKPGKQAILDALADYGIVPTEIDDWPLTDKENISLGGKVLRAQTEDTPAAELGAALAEVMGQRSLAQLTLDSVQDDGKVHPGISTLQRSGRKSTTKPGLTVWTSKGAGAVEKSYYIADDGCQLIEFDYSAADTRIVAAYSGDKRYLELVAPGADPHEVRGKAIFGEERYNSDPGVYRERTKPISHGSNYGLGAEKLAKTLGITMAEAYEIMDSDKKAYPDVEKWKNQVRNKGRSGWIKNDWGREMPVEPDRTHTQSPALMGQSGTREIVVDALIRMLNYDDRLIHWLKAQVHDALVFSIPVADLCWAVPKIKELMETVFRGVEFPVEHGDPADNWQKASHV